MLERFSAIQYVNAVDAGGSLTFLSTIELLGKIFLAGQAGGA